MFHQAQVMGNERFIFIQETQGEGNGLWVKDLKNINPHYVRLADTDGSYNEPIGVANGKLYVMTNAGAPRWKVVSYDIDNLCKASRKDFITECDWVLSGAQLAAGKFIVTYDRDASSHPYVVDAQGKIEREIELPTFGSVGFWSNNSEKEVFYSFTSFTYPTSIYAYDMETGKSACIFAPNVPLKRDDYVTEQVFFTSKDGTRVPVAYRMMAKDNSWRVYDIIVENLSLVKNYRTQFQDILTSGTPDELIARVKAKAEEVRKQPVGK